jgi:DNA modification methylase
MWRLIEADCVVAMRELPDESVDAIVTDPPYGLEFMGKDWDRLDGGLPQENVWKGRRGKGGSSIGDDDSKPGSRHHVSYGAKPVGFKRCAKCGKREFSGSPCECAEPEFVLEYRQEAPSSAIRMQRWHEAWAREAYRVLKPGGHLLAFGGSRTYHRLACAVEDAGFEVRDQMMWLYGSGFPKSLDVSKAIDKAAEAEREVVGIADGGDSTRLAMNDAPGNGRAKDYQSGPYKLTIPSTPEAEKWEGWGTALKPAHEPIVVARKPLSGTVAANVLEFGTGALNIDGCRIEHDGTESWGTVNKSDSRSVYGSFGDEDGETPGSIRNPAGRWPANVILDEEAGRLLDEQSGTLKSGANPTRRGSDGKRQVLGAFGGQEECDAPRGADTGGASRFFYCAKASKAERNAGLDEFEARNDTAHRRTNLKTADRPHLRGLTERKNHHPTVKPIELMRYLCRLVTPPGGTVLDPFTGSGTTGCAAVLEGFEFVGVEREAEYAQIAKARVAWWEKHQAQGDTDDIMRAAGEREETEQAGQLGLLDEAA